LQKKTKSNGDASPANAFPDIETDKFFQYVIERRITEAEKELDSIRTVIPPTEMGKGFLKALEGLMLTARSNNDRYLYLSKIEKTPKKLKELRKEFAKESTNNLHASYDIGYFRALENYMRKLESPSMPQKAGDAEEATRRNQE